MDGHSCVEQHVQFKKDTGQFKTVFASHKLSNGTIAYVIHVSSSTFSLSDPSGPFRFLLDVGFEQFTGGCPYFGNRCFFHELATLQEAPYGYDHTFQALSIGRSAEQFADQIDTLYGLYQSQHNILNGLGFAAKEVKIFAAKPPLITYKPSQVPPWVEDYKFEQLHSLEASIADLQDRAAPFRTYLPLLYSSADELVDATKVALEAMELDVEKSPLGFTVDLRAKTKDNSMKFGIEVTGIDGAIAKNTNKVSQMLQFKQHREEYERTVLLANTYRCVPPSQRKESFTQDFLSLLKTEDWLVMTTYDLYRLLSDVLDKKMSAQAVVKTLFEYKGLFEYKDVKNSPASST